MAPEGQYPGGLHAADAAAYYGHGFGLLGHFDLVPGGLHGFRVQGAAGHTGIVGKRLIVADALIVSHIKAGVVTADAGANAFQIAGHELGDPLRICQKLPGNAYAVYAAFGHGPGSHLRLHAPGADHGDIHKLLNVLCLCQVAVLRHIRGRMGPVPGIVGAVVAVEHVIAGFLQIPGGLFTFFHIPSHFSVGFAGQGALAEPFCFGDYGITQRHGKILSAGGLDGLDDLHRETVAVFKAAAVFVCPLVGIFHGELIQQIAFMNGMDFNAVYPGIHA